MNQKINWCCKQKNGIELIEPNENVSKSYFDDADDSILTMNQIRGKWEVVTAYYSCYNALYALLMKVGIKCEIHDCTLELMFLFDFSKEQQHFLKALKQNRIDVQYYLKPALPISSLQIKQFVTLCKSLAEQLNEDKINKLRRSISQK